MEDQLILFETAKLAEEKGFDISTGAECWVRTLGGDIIHNSERRSIIEHDRVDYYLSQPTQSLLQKWLREVHNIDVFVNYPYDDPEYAADVRIPFGKRKLLDGFTIFETYEEALEEGLQEALKFIKY